MTNKQKQRLGVIAGIIVLALLILLPSIAKVLKKEGPTEWFSNGLKLGLDLKGGTYLVLGVQTHEAIKSQLSAVAGSLKSTMRKERIVGRAKQFGERGVEVTVFREEDVERVKNIVTAEYRDLKSTKEDRSGGNINLVFEIGQVRVHELEESAVLQAIETIRNRVDQYGVTEPTIQRQGSKLIVVQLPDITDIDLVKKTIGKVAKLEFRLVSDSRSKAAETISLPHRDGGQVTLDDEVLMSGDAVETASVEVSAQNSEVQVSLKLNRFGAKTFDRITSENIGRNLAIVLDGVVQSSPTIRERISGGQASITGGFTGEEANRLAIVLKSGALPAPLTFEEERTVGASLGADSIRSGFFSMVVGSCLVFVFAIIYYKKSGLVAVAALTLNILLLMAMLALFGATLTLPGIAGLALTIGMAIDGNIVIYERIKEELRKGVTARAAIEAGFAQAHWTILDANITTFLTGVILYGFGTGPIKGFAVTLCLGIISTLFTVLYFTRTGFEVFGMMNRKGRLSI